MTRKIIVVLCLVLVVSFAIFFINRRINVVLFGTDNVEKNSYRADTIIFVSYKPFTKNLMVLSIPRDTVVELPHKNGKEQSNSLDKIKINAVYMYGFVRGGRENASKLLRETVGKLIGVKVPFYVHIDYTGFVKIIDSIGGIEVKVNKRMKYKDVAGKLDIDIMPGIHNFNGSKALEYIRYRSTESADIGRINRHHEFIKAVMKKITSEYSIKNLVDLTKIIFKYIDTNLLVNDIILLVNKVKDIRDVKVDTLPGEPIYVKGVSYWYPDYQKIQVVVKEMLN